MNNIIKSFVSYNNCKSDYKRFFAAVCIVFKEGKVLLGKSTLTDDRLGKWCFPGGGRDKDETIYQVATRELLEETGIKGEPLNMSPIVDTDIKGIAFIPMKYKSGSIKMNEEFDDMDWFSLDDLPKETFKSNRSILKKFSDELYKYIEIEKKLVKSKENTVQKGFTNDLSKSMEKDGKYKDNAQNRAKGIVGQPYHLKKVLSFNEEKQKHIVTVIHDDSFVEHDVRLTQQEKREYNELFHSVELVRPARSNLFFKVREKDATEMKKVLGMYWSRFIPDAKLSKVRKLETVILAEEQLLKIKNEWQREYEDEGAVSYMKRKYVAQVDRILGRTENIRKKAHQVIDKVDELDVHNTGVDKVLLDAEKAANMKQSQLAEQKLKEKYEKEDTEFLESIKHLPENEQKSRWDLYSRGTLETRRTLKGNYRGD